MKKKADWIKESADKEIEIDKLYEFIERCVELTPEESGVLCHLLMSELTKAGFSLPVEFGTRMAVLYNKLVRANNKLMGKV